MIYIFETIGHDRKFMVVEVQAVGHSRRSIVTGQIHVMSSLFPSNDQIGTRLVVSAVGRPHQEDECKKDQDRN